MKTFKKPLSRQEEMECLQKYKEGDVDARNMLIEHNLRLVAHVAKKYQSPELEMDDLLSIGIIGLIKAIMTFDSEKNSRLATYAVRCIENELLMMLRGRKKLSREVSMYERIGTDPDGGELRLMDVLESEPFDILEEMENRKNTGFLLRHLKEMLSDREYFVICRRYGLFDTKILTQREIAQKMGISRSYVSRLEKKALEKLKEELEQNNAKEYGEL